MTVKPSRPGGCGPGGLRPSGGKPTTKPSVGRPKGEPSTIVNVRLPLTLVAELDRYLDRLEVQTGLKANRGMIARRALELFLASHAATDATAREGEEVALSSITGIVVYNRRRDGRLSHITETQGAWPPDRRLTKREKCLLTRG